MSELWRGLRLVVLDLETCVFDHAHRPVALGVAICRAGRIKRRYEWLINPECPIDSKTSTIHRLTDEDLADEPTLRDVLPEFLPLLAAQNGERVVLAAHNAGFDLGWLASDIARVKGPPLPDLAVLDTSGPIRKLAGLSLRSRRLSALLDALTLKNVDPHDALADASATALAACELLRRLEAAGRADLGALLTELEAPTVTTVKAVRAEPRRVVNTPTRPELPPEHVATHAQSLPPNPNGAEVAQWRGWVAECARLRCAGLARRTGDGDRLRAILLDVLADAIGAGDPAGVATLLGALIPLLGSLPETIVEMRAEAPGVARIRGMSGRRGVAVAFFVWLDRLLAPIPRCAAQDLCPSCRAGDGCPRDTWHHGLVPSVINFTGVTTVSNFWNTNTSSAIGNKSAGRGYLIMRPIAPALADGVLRACHDFYRMKGERTTAELLADQAWTEGGCRDPQIAESRALVTAAGGRPADIVAALRMCRRVLVTRDGNTDPAWDHLAARAAHLGGRLERLRTANERHHPLAPTRPARPFRFLREPIPLPLRT